jgi:hypothetical protein
MWRRRGGFQGSRGKGEESREEKEYWREVGWKGDEREEGDRGLEGSRSKGNGKEGGFNLNPTGLSQIWLTLLHEQNAPRSLK